MLGNNMAVSTFEIRKSLMSGLTVLLRWDPDRNSHRHWHTGLLVPRYYNNVKKYRPLAGGARMTMGVVPGITSEPRLADLPLQYVDWNANTHWGIGDARIMRQLQLVQAKRSDYGVQMGRSMTAIGGFYLFGIRHFRQINHAEKHRCRAVAFGAVGSVSFTDFPIMWSHNCAEHISSFFAGWITGTLS